MTESKTCPHDYDFMGNLLSNRHVHSNAQTTISELTVYTYDNQNRLLTCTHSLNGQPAVTVINNEYDALGRLSANRRNGHTLLETQYRYNVRSWLTNISSPLFTETMYYNTEAPFTSTPAYGGNISALSWLSEDSIQRGYSLSYDSASRLTSADYRENETSSTKYQASYTYDANGNVTSLQRYGRYVSDWRLVDDLAYTYQGNRLQRVSKSGVSPKYYGAMYFHDGATANTEYEYDENGNMTKDLNRKISSIQYNLLNLPTKVTMTDDRTISYTYTAEGEKRRVISFVPYETPVPFPDTLIYIPVDPVPFPGFPGLGVTGAEVQGGVLPFNPIPTGISDTLTYCGNFIYRKGTLKRVLFDGGYVTPGTAGSAPEYHFFIRDHLGNNRLVLSSTGQVEQANHYYPFGATTYESTDSVAQPYKYNGKELERTADVDWYDYGARFYDPVLARFTTMDPLCEKYYNVSPYAYCANNPVNAVDLDGRNPIYGTNGAFLGTDDRGIKGGPLVIEEDYFKQGMSHDDVVERLFAGNLSKEAHLKMDEHISTLSSRPDYDGFVTISEGISWAKSHMGAIDNPTPDNMLYIDASKLSFGDIRSQFKGVGVVSPINLFTDKNTFMSICNPILRSTIYALGRVDMILEGDGHTVEIVNDYYKTSGRATDYDWNDGGSKKKVNSNKS